MHVIELQHRSSAAQHPSLGWPKQIAGGQNTICSLQMIALETAGVLHFQRFQICAIHVYISLTRAAAAAASAAVALSLIA